MYRAPNRERKIRRGRLEKYNANTYFFSALMHLTLVHHVLCSVFPSEIIQPLFDMANRDSDIYRSLDNQLKLTGKLDSLLASEC